MKINFGSPWFQLPALRFLPVCTLAVISLLSLGGCASPADSTSSPDNKPGGAAVVGHSEVIILREGDVVKVSFPDAANLDVTLPIRRDGKISLQDVGEVQAAGLTIDQLQNSLIQLESSSFPVFVTGQVVHPGKILSDHPLTALEAVMEAGGFDFATANTSAVKIIRNDNGVMKHYVVNLQRILDGKDAAPFYLQPDDIIYVSERFEMF
jgi:polysaccharide export outer membrane protein